MNTQAWLTQGVGAREPRPTGQAPMRGVMRALGPPPLCGRGALHKASVRAPLSSRRSVVTQVLTSPERNVDP